MKTILRKTGYLTALAIAAGYALVAFRGPNGIPALLEKRAEIAVLQEQNATMAADNKRKQDRIRKLETDRSVQELEIRKRLKLLHPGETQFILPDPKPEPKE